MRTSAATATCRCGTQCSQASHAPACSLTVIRLRLKGYLKVIPAMPETAWLMLKRSNLQLQIQPAAATSSRAARATATPGSLRIAAPRRPHPLDSTCSSSSKQCTLQMSRPAAGTATLALPPPESGDDRGGSSKKRKVDASSDEDCSGRHPSPSSAPKQVPSHLLLTPYANQQELQLHFSKHVDCISPLPTDLAVFGRAKAH